MLTLDAERGVTLADLYAYYESGGAFAALCHFVGRTLSQAALVLLCAVALGFTNWTSLLTCGAAGTCAPLATYVLPLHPITPYKAWVLFQTTLVAAWWLAATASMPQHIVRMYACRAYLRDVVCVCERDAVLMEWVELLAQVQNAAVQLQYAAAPLQLIPMTTLHRGLLHVENYWVMLHACGVLRRAEWEVCGACVTTTRFFHYVLTLGVLEDVTSKEFLRCGTLPRPRALHRRLLVIAWLHALLLPVLGPVAGIVVALRSVESMHSRLTPLGARALTPAALWQLRAVNEAAHAFARRAQSAQAAVCELIAVVSSASTHCTAVATRVVAAVARGLLRVCIGALVLLAVVDERIVTHVTVGARNLLWLLGVLTVAAASLQKLQPPTIATAHVRAERAFNAFMAAAHDVPAIVYGCRHGVSAYETFETLTAVAPTALTQAWHELRCVVMLPLLLGGSGGARATAAILDALRTHTEYCNALGVHTCSISREAASSAAAATAQLSSSLLLCQSQSDQNVDLEMGVLL